MTALATVHGGFVGIGEIVLGTGEAIKDAGTVFLYGSALVGNEIYHDLKIFDEYTYKSNYDMYSKLVVDSASNLNPMNMIEGIGKNFKETLNIDNFKKFLDKDTNYLEKVDYANKATKTGLTVYGIGKTSYQLGKGIYQVTHPTEMVMRSVKVSNVNTRELGNVGNQYSITKTGLSSTINKASFKTYVDYMNPIDASRYTQYWEQVRQGLSAEQRYNKYLYDDIDGSLNYKVYVTKNHKVSVHGRPGTIVRKIDKDGILQDRIYGLSGNVFKDIDYYHIEKPGSHIFPHMHQFIWENDNIIDRITK